MYFTDAKSVRPGRIARTSANCERNGSTYLGTSGPRANQTHISNEHVHQLRQLVKLNLRKSRPTFVTRSSFPTVRSVLCAGALVHRSEFVDFERTKPLPTRTCRKITGPCESSMIRPRSHQSGHMNNSPTEATQISKARLIIFGSPSQGFSQYRSLVSHPVPSFLSTKVMRDPLKNLLAMGSLWL